MQLVGCASSATRLEVELVAALGRVPEPTTSDAVFVHRPQLEVALALTIANGLLVVVLLDLAEIVGKLVFRSVVGEPRFSWTSSSVQERDW